MTDAVYLTWPLREVHSICRPRQRALAHDLDRIVGEEVEDSALPFDIHVRDD
jgi:hypothetical protein